MVFSSFNSFEVWSIWRSVSLRRRRLTQEKKEKNHFAPHKCINNNSLLSNGPQGNENGIIRGVAIPIACQMLARDTKTIIECVAATAAVCLGRFVLLRSQNNNNNNTRACKRVVVLFLVLSVFILFTKKTIVSSLLNRGSKQNRETLTKISHSVAVSFEDSQFEVVPLTAEKVLEFIEEAYPNPVTAEDLARYDRFTSSSWNSFQSAKFISDFSL